MLFELAWMVLKFTSYHCEVTRFLCSLRDFLIYLQDTFTWLKSPWEEQERWYLKEHKLSMIFFISWHAGIKIFLCSPQRAHSHYVVTASLNIFLYLCIYFHFSNTKRDINRCISTLQVQLHSFIIIVTSIMIIISISIVNCLSEKSQCVIISLSPNSHFRENTHIHVQKHSQVK